MWGSLLDSQSEELWVRIESIATTLFIPPRGNYRNKGWRQKKIKLQNDDVYVLGAVMVTVCLAAAGGRLDTGGGGDTAEEEPLALSASQVGLSLAES